ncbi:MAG: pyridoxine 5'-phosphate synthase [Crocinitomicaceae bacterium]|nr:pyridoxine 5'-phosphate synthase [Crocinitomicaceae bacterium]
MAKLSVNINKIATLRNARGGNVPNLVQVAIDCQEYGAEGITVHPRPDERHITTQDVYDLKRVVKTEYNIEGYPNERFLKLIEEIKPEQATLVPDPPGVLTSNAGWNTVEHFDFLSDVIHKLKTMGVRTSIFIENDRELLEYAAKTGVDRVEFYTGPFAEDYALNKEEAIAPYVESARICKELGLGINAGHDLSLENLKYFKENIDGLLEVSIGHAIISDALYFGLENTISMYKNLLK